MDVWELHPALVHFPIAFLVGGVLLDLYAWGRGGEPERVATDLLLAGVAAAVVAALAGVLAFYTVPPAHTTESERLVLRHIVSAVVALVGFSAVAALRWKRQPAPPSTAVRVAGLVEAAAVVAAAALGGRIVYHGGMGVDPGVVAPSIQKNS